MAIPWSQIPVYPIGIITNFQVMVAGKQVDDVCCRTGTNNTTRLLIPGLQRHTRLLSFNKIIWQLSLEKAFTVEKKIHTTVNPEPRGTFHVDCFRSKVVP